MLGIEVNLEGTRHVLDLASRCPDLHRLHYVSTCYVSGRYSGVVALQYPGQQSGSEKARESSEEVGRYGQLSS